MRGRAAEIADPGGLDWDVVWEALKTEPPAEDPSTITQELGLDQEQEIEQPYGGPASSRATAFSGTRHGRPVALRIGVVPGIRQKGVNEVQVGAPVAPFRVREDGGRPVAEPGATPEVEEVLGELAPAAEVWRKLEIEGGPEGILARRPVTAHPQGYVYDLWLAERLAERLGA
jgi:hypothetical protein